MSAHEKHKIIDLTQGDSDSDFPGKVEPVPPGAAAVPATHPSKKPAYLPQPLSLAGRPFQATDPFKLPLINITHSTAYAFTASTIDPFSN
jgi:hypothetical protein